jgi:DNA-directed RNA polymerase subunit beta
MQESGVAEVEPMLAEELIGKVFAHDIINMETGEVLFDCNEEITEQIDKLLEAASTSSRCSSSTT